MVRQQGQGKGPKTGEGEAESRQPAWREKAPAHPRKRVKRKQMTAPASRGRADGKGGTGRPVFVLPARETWLTILRVSAMLLVAAAATLGLIYLLHWPELSVVPASTEIGGMQRIPGQEIYLSAGIDGRNVLLLRPDQIAAQVRQIPGVAAVAVHVRLPNQVIIDIREHAPLVAWQTITNTVWLAEDGSEVPQAGALPPLHFGDLSEGRLSKDAELHKLVLENLALVHAARPNLNEFYYADEPGLYYRAPEGWDVWLGDSGPMSDKLALADAAGQEIARKGSRPKIIDVRQSESKAMWW